MSDTLTILTSLDRPCTKSFELINGEVISGDDKKPFQFDVREQAITGLDDLSQALGALESDRQVTIIRGKSVNELPVLRVRRLNENFQAEPRQWCLIDIDDLPIPKGLEDFKSHLPELVENSIQQLPPEFQNVDCWYQFSSSMGIKHGKIRIHLWFWLSRKATDIEMQAWLDGAPVDLSLFICITLQSRCLMEVLLIRCPKDQGSMMQVRELIPSAFPMIWKQERVQLSANQDT